jgi:drug/metabolite transporter (DMT)-like permease
MSSSRLDARAIVLAVLIMAILGGTYTMVKVGLRDLPVVGSLLLRMLVATAALGAYARWAGVTLLYRGRAAWFIAAGTLAFIVMQLLLYAGLTATPAGRAAILYNIQPFLTLLVLPCVLPAERLTFRRVLGTGMAFGGVVLVLAERGTSGGSLLGDALVLLAAVTWTMVIILSKTTPSEVNAVSLIFWNVAGAAPVLALLTVILEPSASWRLSAPAVASILYLGVLAAGVGFVGFVWLTRTYAATRVNAFVFLSPVFGVLIAWAALGESATALQAAGALGVASGIWIVNTGR